jgi:cell division protein FtsL
MNIFGKKRRTSLAYKEIILSLIGLLIIVAVSFPLAKILSKRYAINKEINQLQTEINQLDNKNNGLKKMISYLNSNEFIDEEARTSLNLKKENEQVAVVINNKENNNETNKGIYKIAGDELNTSKKIIDNNAIRWWRYFF